MPDWWELGYFGNTTSQVGNGDADNDGLNNQAEFQAGTIPNVADTDGDGLNDNAEITAGTDPLKFNFAKITVAGTFQSPPFTAEPFPANTPVNVMTAGTGANQFLWKLDSNFPITATYLGKFANGEVFTSSNNINWGTSGTSGVAQRGGVGNDIPFNVSSTGWWTFSFNTDTLSYGFTRKVFSSYLEYAAAYNLPADGSGGGQTEDYDSDGLTNAEEFAANSNPTSSDSDEDTVPDAYEVNTSTTSPILADTDADTLPDWWELTVGLDAKSGTGADGASGNPDGDGFTNKQEYDGQSNPNDIASVPANREVTFSLNLNRQISSGAFLTNSHTVEVWGTFNDWGNFTNKFSLTNNGSGIYTGTHTLAGAEGATNRYKYVTFPSSNNAVFESGNDRTLVMGANGVATNLPTAYLGEVRPVTFSVNLGVQVALGRFAHGTDKVYVVGDVVGSWTPPGTELARVGSTDVYSGEAFVSGAEAATANYKFYVNNSLGFEGDVNPDPNQDTRVLVMGARDTAQTVTEAYFNNVETVPANRTVTFAVNMNVQTNTNKLSFNPATDFVEVRGDFNSFGGGTDWRLTNNGAGIYTRSFVLTGNEGVTNAYKYVAVIVTATNTNSVWERVDIPRTNELANRTFVLGPTNTPQVVHSVASPALFAGDDGIGPVITLNGDNPLNLTNGATWSDPGATATDAIDGSVTATPSGTVDTTTAGTYTITYNASDAAGNAATPVSRTVIVAAADPLTDYMTSFNLTGANAAGTADPDGDGQDNNAELAFGTDPTNGASRSATLASGTGIIKLVYLQRNSGVTYTVKSFTDLSTPFDSGGTVVTPTATNPQPADTRAGYTQYEASLSTGSSKGFLRVKAVR